MTISYRFFALAAAAAAAALGALAETDAATIRFYRDGAIPDPAVVARILGKPRRMKFRGLENSTIEPVPSDAGENLSEEDIRAQAAAAVSAWETKRGGQDIASRSSDATASSEPVAAVIDRAAANQPNVSASPAGAAALVNEPGQAAGDAHHAAPPAQADRRNGDRATVLAILVRFANDSARLSTDARAPLAAIAAGIRLAGTERRILVEGHANSTGSPVHNLKLSQLRAEAVKRYLVETHGIPADVLLAKGFGTLAPLDRRHPGAAENRRVQFRAADA